MGVMQAVLLLCLAGSSLAALAMAPAVENPAHPGKCWSAKQKKAYADGDMWQEPNCTRAECFKDNGKLFVEYATCGAVDTHPGCHLKQGDQSKPYPECCPTVMCDRRIVPHNDELYDEFINWISEHYDNPIAME